MEKIRKIPNLSGKMLAYHVVGLAGILYATYSVGKFIRWHIRSIGVRNLARKTLSNRN